MSAVRVRRLLVAAVAGLVLAFSASASARAAESYFLQTSNASSSWATYSQALGTASEVPGPMRLQVVRDGVVIENRLGDWRSYPSGSAWSTVESPVALRAGDRVEWFVPAAASAPTRVHVWDARPTMESCPVGGRTVSGTANTGTRSISVRLLTPSPGPYDSSYGDAQVVQTGLSWTGTFRRQLLASDVLEMYSSYTPDPTLDLHRHERVHVGQCGAVVPPVPVAISASDGALEPLRKRDVKQRKTTVTVRVTCLAASKIPCRGRVGLQTIGRYATASAKRKRVALGSKRLSVAPGKTKVLKLKLKRSGVKLLKRRGKLKSRVAAVTKSPTGKNLTRSRTVTLKRPPKPKKKKKN